MDLQKDFAGNIVLSGILTFLFYSLVYPLTVFRGLINVAWIC